jgi:hypothetical protein
MSFWCSITIIITGTKERRFHPPLCWILTFDIRGATIAWAPCSQTFIRILFTRTNTGHYHFHLATKRKASYHSYSTTAVLLLHHLFSLIYFIGYTRSYKRKNTGFSNEGHYHSTTILTMEPMMEPLPITAFIDCSPLGLIQGSDFPILGIIFISKCIFECIPKIRFWDPKILIQGSDFPILGITFISKCIFECIP